MGLRRLLKGRHLPEEAPRDVQLDDADLRQRLSRQEYRVLRKAGTEAPFAGEYVHTKDDGMYHCRACNAALFRSEAKFDSGTGWPSFDSPAGSDSVELRTDHSMLMRRTEVLCRACGSHLGHLFGDGPTTTRQRYCINSCALELEPDAEA